MRGEDFAGAIAGFLYFGGMVFLFVLLAWIGRRARAAIARGDGLARIVTTLKGEVTRDPGLEEPYIRFKTGDIPVYCHQWLLFEGRSEVVTTFECRVGFRAFFEATSHRSKRYPSRSTRFREMPVESSYRIVTTDAAWAEEILDSGLRSILAEFSGRWRRARIQLAVDRFLVEVESELTPAQAADAARVIARLAALARESKLSAGVTFLDGVEVGIRGRCPVCGQAFDVAGVSCALCKVPHHSDCWAYWGRCAIFGCRGQRIALPTSASL